MAEFRELEKSHFVEKIVACRLNPDELILEKHGDGFQFRYLDSGIVFNLYPTEETPHEFRFSYTDRTPDRALITYMSMPHPLYHVLASFGLWLNIHVMFYIQNKGGAQPWKIYQKEHSELLTWVYP